MINTTFDLNTAKNNEEDLTKEEKYYRLKIIEKMASEDGPININDLNIEKKMIDSLSEKGMIVLDETYQNIRFVYPVSGEPTQHEITLKDGRIFHSMCAIDSLGATFTFGQDLNINSKCSTSGEPIYIEIREKEIFKTNSDEIFVIHVDLNEGTDWFASC